MMVFRATHAVKPTRLSLQVRQPLRDFCLFFILGVLSSHHGRVSLPTDAGVSGPARGQGGGEGVAARTRSGACDARFVDAALQSNPEAL